MLKPNLLNYFKTDKLDVDATLNNLSKNEVTQLEALVELAQNQAEGSTNQFETFDKVGEKLVVSPFVASLNNRFYHEVVSKYRFNFTSFKRSDASNDYYAKLFKAFITANHQINAPILANMDEIDQPIAVKYNARMIDWAKTPIDVLRIYRLSLKWQTQYVDNPRVYVNKCRSFNGNPEITVLFDNYDQFNTFNAQVMDYDTDYLTFVDVDKLDTTKFTRIQSVTDITADYR